LLVFLESVVIAVLWKTLQQERKRCNFLIDQMLELSKEATIMIERITGR